MRNSKLNLGIVLLVFASFMACKNTNNEKTHDNHSEMDHSEMNENSEMMEAAADAPENVTGSENQDSETGIIVNDYLKLKDALVADNSEGAAQAGQSLVAALESFDMSSYDAGEQQELNEIIADAKEHAEHISRSDMAHQREHFEILSIDLIDMLAITGYPGTLYQQFCPMYNENKGGTWLSDSEEVRNPYFGQSMLTCGKVQREI